MYEPSGYISYTVEEKVLQLNWYYAKSAHRYNKQEKVVHSSNILDTWLQCIRVPEDNIHDAEFIFLPYPYFVLQWKSMIKVFIFLTRLKILHSISSLHRITAITLANHYIAVRRPWSSTLYVTRFKLAPLCLLANLICRKRVH